MSERTMDESERAQLVAAVKGYCLQELETAWEQAGISGLCADGRWEVAIGRVSSLNSEEILAALSLK